MESILTPIREMEIVEDEMLGFITGGSADSTNACGKNNCLVHSGNCTIENQCQLNKIDCERNSCGVHQTEIEVPGPECQEHIDPENP